MVELVDTRDLKSLEGNFVPVQVRLWAPEKFMENYSLIYIQETYYLENLNVVLRNLENTNYKYISRRTLKSIPKENQYIVKNTFDVITVLFSLRKINFEKFIASNVDDFLLSFNF